MAFSSPGDLERGTAVRCKDSAFLYLSSFQNNNNNIGQKANIQARNIMSQAFCWEENYFFQEENKRVTCSHTAINGIYQM